MQWRKKIRLVLFCLLILMISGVKTKAQEHPIRAGDDFPLAGLGNPIVFRPAALFGNPALLAADSLRASAEISVDQWTDIKLSKRTELNAAFALKEAGGLGFRLARIGDENFRITELGAAFGLRLSENQNSSDQWSIGASVQYQRIRWPPGYSSGGWQSGLSINLRQKQNLWVLRAAYASTENYSTGNGEKTGGQWDLRIGCRHNWSGQVSTDIMTVFNSLEEHRVQLGLHYQILPRLFVRWMVQSRPSLVGWEQGYRLKFGWLMVHCIRYPAIGWKTGIGILISRPGKPVRDE